MTREQYKKELEQFAQSKEDYKYCLRPSYSYPFIEYQDEVFLPTPHLLIQSITTAMMNRLTFDNLELREKIGKNACEEYLWKIVEESDLFDEVVSEYEYSKGQRTIDLITRKGKDVLLIDSKLFSPKVSLRTFNEDAYIKDEDRIVKALRQAYIHAHDKFGYEYNPFFPEIDDVYAIVVVYQDGYNDLGAIYEKTAHSLSIDSCSEEYEWLWHHIGFTDVATFERFMLTKTDVFQEIRSRELLADKWLTGKNLSFLTKEIHQYQEKVAADAEDIFEEMYA